VETAQARRGFLRMPIDSSADRLDPGSEYRHRLGLLGIETTQLEKRHTILGYIKLAILLSGLIAAIWILATQIDLIYFVFVPVIFFVVVAIVHERVLQASRRCSRIIGFYERGLDRIGDRWAGKGETGERFLDNAHPYSRDLDLFGPGSLFELLSTARTRAGQDILASWLLAPAPAEEVRLRHAAVIELRERLDLREELAVLGEHVRSGVQPEALAAWGEKAPVFDNALLRPILLSLALLWCAGAAVWAIWGYPWLFLLTTVVNVSVGYAFRDRMCIAVPAIEEAAQDLKLLSAVLDRLEREKFLAPKLVNLQASLQKDGVLASRSVARLSRLVDFLVSRRGLIVQAFDRFVFWTLQSSVAIEAWRKQFGPPIRPWLAALGELEALSDLAGYAYEHPEDTFPEFTGDAPCLEAEALSHPLIPWDRAISNDLNLGRDLRIMIISGPNMAGKSTFVRAVGINAVLAQCGAPVRARRLRLSALSVAASVCILDSLQGGISRFYAEISRLKLIIDMTKGRAPVLFLLDELLQGTNSHDRRIGAAAIARSLFNHGAIGLLTTHDLALAEIADALGPQVANFHFEDRFEDGKLRFDYHLTPGIVRTSNALELMRSIGLDV
jgi:MutS domain V